ncbi:MAG: zinc ribbon domain-containing protein [Candidatus Aenigmarchaeota archaeon]|nr:zinc ribbon domain-containing protein [Candidatus Aenigmarchaeota archaeon]
MLVNSSGPSSFVVMLVGLGVAAIGSAHGRKMREMGQFGIEDLMREGGPRQPFAEGGREGEPEEQPPAPKGQQAPEEEMARTPEMGSQEQAIRQAEEAPGRGGIMSIFRRGPSMSRLKPDDVMNIELQDIRSGKLVPTEADVIELVCPRCNAENDEKNFYCYSCGNKLRRKPSKDSKAKREIPLEPGSIAVVGDQRVAKVVICPKCNAANKQSDKFCFNCGKKLRTERAKRIEEGQKKIRPIKKSF